MWTQVNRALFQTHVESRLKQEIIEEPEKYVELDPELAATLLDIKDSGKVLMLITNSDWEYTDRMMSFSYDRCASCSCLCLLELELEKSTTRVQHTALLHEY
jgi:hypothetical protein